MSTLCFVKSQRIQSQNLTTNNERIPEKERDDVHKDVLEDLDLHWITGTSRTKYEVLLLGKRFTSSSDNGLTYTVVRKYH